MVRQYFCTLYPCNGAHYSLCYLEIIENLLRFHYNCHCARIPHNNYPHVDLPAIVVEGELNSHYHVTFSRLCNVASNYGQSGYTE